MWFNNYKKTYKYTQQTRGSKITRNYTNTLTMTNSRNRLLTYDDIVVYDCVLYCLWSLNNGDELPEENVKLWEIVFLICNCQVKGLLLNITGRDFCLSGFCFIRHHDRSVRIFMKSVMNHVVFYFPCCWIYWGGKNQ